MHVHHPMTPARHFSAPRIWIDAFGHATHMIVLRTSKYHSSFLDTDEMRRADSFPRKRVKSRRSRVPPPPTEATTVRLRRPLFFLLLPPARRRRGGSAGSHRRRPNQTGKKRHEYHVQSFGALPVFDDELPPVHGFRKQHFFQRVEKRAQAATYGVRGEDDVVIDVRVRHRKE